jgi:hypothetical protein
MKRLVALFLICIIFIVFIVVVLRYILAIYYKPIVNEFVTQNLKSEYIETKISLSPIVSEYGSSKIMSWLGLYNWYNFDWEKNDIKFKVLYKPNLDIILAIEDNGISNVDLASAYEKVSKYLLLPDRLDFECDSNVCISTWENRRLVVGKLEAQNITIILGEEVK